ncbi:MAG TPA: VapC toxin family PIN domain ribonuclease [Candidatus Macondimonas sp.]|nr:VapC toxin family PIN domain ribonuclease [Candidatus Macondimonas sp.]
MIVPDANVIFEAMKPEPDAALRARSERSSGGNPVPVERHAGRVAVWHPRAAGAVPGSRPSVDTDAARHYADLAVTVRNGGRGFPTPDGYIAAVAASQGFIVASRDTSPFEAAGVTVINPWWA